MTPIMYCWGSLKVGYEKEKKTQQILRNQSLKIKKCSNTVRSNLSLQPSGLIGFDHLRNPYSLNRKLIEGMEEIKTHRNMFIDRSVIC